MKMARQVISAPPLADPRGIAQTTRDDMPVDVVARVLLQSSAVREVLQALASRGCEIWGKTGWWQRVVAGYTEKAVTRQLAAIGEA